MTGRLILIAAAVLFTAGAAWAQSEQSTPLPRTSFSADEKRDVERIVRDYLLTHPEIIVRALQTFEANQKVAAETRARRLVAENLSRLEPVGPEYVAGNPDGDVTVFEFFDYRCPYCKRSFPGLMKTIKKDGNVRLVLKEFPILGQDSVLAARAALAAGAQGRYIEMHEALMQVNGAFTEERILDIAADQGLDIERLADDMYRPKVDDMIRRTYDLARTLEIRGTPAFVVGTEMIPGAVDGERLKALIAKARSG